MLDFCSIKTFFKCTFIYLIVLRMGERLTWQRGREEAPKSSIPSKFESGDKAEKIGFLYDQQQTDRESYLTGKKVDKAFDDYLDREKRNFENSLNP